jgi:hypothetical protein
MIDGFVEITRVIRMIDEMASERELDCYGNYIPRDRWHLGTLLRLRNLLGEMPCGNESIQLLAAYKESGLSIDECIQQIRAAAGIKAAMEKMRMERLTRPTYLGPGIGGY